MSDATARLVDAARRIKAISCGEEQVANDDTEALEYIHALVSEALAAYDADALIGEQSQRGGDAQELLGELVDAAQWVLDGYSASECSVSRMKMEHLRIALYAIKQAHPPAPAPAPCQCVPAEEPCEVGLENRHCPVHCKPAPAVAQEPPKLNCSCVPDHGCPIHGDYPVKAAATPREATLYDLCPNGCFYGNFDTQGGTITCPLCENTGRLKPREAGKEE